MLFQYLCIKEVIQIILKFSEFERFNPSISNRDLAFDDDNKTVYIRRYGIMYYNPRYIPIQSYNVFGEINCIPKHLYQWKLQFMTDIESSACIGIAEADKYHMRMWFYRQEFGFSYDINHYWGGSNRKENHVRQGDIIQIDLDLKYQNKLVFRKNGQRVILQSFAVKRNMVYRLAIALFKGKLKIISFEMSE